MSRPLALWGGVECSVVRVKDRFRDQICETGHDLRASRDLEEISKLGIKTLRYPFLWERICPRHPDVFDWSWQDKRVGEMQLNDLTPIAGLLHHGSGPAYTSLADPELPRRLRDFAYQVARRYPHIRDWTPINEPLTTARFSGLYGLWYPHGRDERLFWHLLLNQIEAIGQAMTAIRRVRSDARLVQTEDLARVLATPDLAVEAEFQNHRRWLTWDLLCGLVTENHPLWERIARFELGDRLRAIADAPCAPDILGANHYLTSNRFLDGRDKKGARPFEDIEAIRVHADPPSLAALIQETWDRYHRPIAITEVHIGCTRDEQMRWLHQAFTIAERLREEGVDMCAVTCWALLGCMDWASLLTKREGVYEPGVFDTRSGQARPTAMARLVEALISGEKPAPHLAYVRTGPGWWERSVRFNRAPFGGSATQVQDPNAPPAGPPVLVIGDGALGDCLVEACGLRGLAIAVMRRPVLDITLAEIKAAIGAFEPWAVINACTLSDIRLAKRRSEPYFATDGSIAAGVAAVCAQFDIPCVTFSSHLVFSGKRSTPYRESDQTDPCSVHGRSETWAEGLIEFIGGQQLIIRSAPFFGGGRPNFAAQLAAQLTVGQPVRVCDTHTFTPTYLPDVANAILDLLIDGETGIWHLSNGEPVSWAGFAAKLAAALRVDLAQIEPRLRRPATRRNSALVSNKGTLLPSLENAILRFAADFVAPNARAALG